MLKMILQYNKNFSLMFANLKVTLIIPRKGSNIRRSNLKLVFILYLTGLIKVTATVKEVTGLAVGSNKYDKEYDRSLQSLLNIHDFR